jgi:hypothetical protein
VVIGVPKFREVIGDWGKWRLGKEMLIGKRKGDWRLGKKWRLGKEKVIGENGDWEKMMIPLISRDMLKIGEKVIVKKINCEKSNWEK